MRTPILAAAIAVALTPAAFAGDDHSHDHSHDHDHGDEARGLDAHEHGSSVLKVALEDGELHMELEAPGADIVGFETKPESADERAAVEAAMATLKDPIALFGPSAAAGCEIEKADVELHVEEATGHSEFHAEYHLECADLTALSGMDFGYFDAFAGAEEVDVTIVSDTGQTAFEVQRGAPQLDLEGAI